MYEINIEKGLDPKTEMLPPMLMQPLAENAIKHGIGGLKEKGKIIVSLSKSAENFIRCTVQDNGTGFVEKPLMAKKSSLALQILRERLQQYAKSKNSELISISNRSEDSSAMTTVTIDIPAQKA